MNLTKINLFETDVTTYFNSDEEYLQLKENINAAVNESKEIDVMTSNDVNTASHYLKNFKSLGKKIEDLRKRVKQPFADKGKEIDEFFKTLANNLSLELERLDSELRAFQIRERKKAQEEAERIRREEEEKAIQRGIEEEERRKKRGEVIERIRESANEIKLADKSLNDDNIKKVLNKMNGFPQDLTEDEWEYILGTKEELEIPDVEPAIVAEVQIEERKISALNTSGLHTRRSKKWRMIDFVSFVKSLSDSEIGLYLEPNDKAINTERQKFDFKANSSLKGIEFYFDESLV